MLRQRGDLRPFFPGPDEPDNLPRRRAAGCPGGHCSTRCTSNRGKNYGKDDPFDALVDVAFNTSFVELFLDPLQFDGHSRKDRPWQRRGCWAIVERELNTVPPSLFVVLDRVKAIRSRSNY